MVTTLHDRPYERPCETCHTACDRTHYRLDSHIRCHLEAVPLRFPPAGCGAPRCGTGPPRCRKPGGARQPAQRHPRGAAVGRAGTRPGQRGGTPGLLFHTVAGTALDQDYYGHRVFGKAVVKVNTTIREANAKLPADTAQAAELPASTTSHDLRHHFASVLK